ncbi:DHH family phosphoesterase [Metamycoplasma spumans]|uniref:DHH family phosphoesterase n=1 Tax=Metamycoplasma spumans TaxID=92406 RepID=UPI00048119C9
MWIKKHRKTYLIIEIVFLFLLPTILFFVGIFKLDKVGQIIVSVLYTLAIIGMAIFLLVRLSNYLKNSAVAKNTLNYFIQSEIGQYNVGFISFLNNGKIILTSNFIESRFGKKIIGENIANVFNVKEWTINNQDFKFSKDNFEYEVHVSFDKNLVVIKDITTQTNLLNDYKRQRIVFGELSVDNINLYQVLLSQEEVFKLYAGVINVLDDLAKKYNLIYRQYENGRFFLISNQETLEIFEKDNFSFFSNIKNKLFVKDVSVTLSAGFAYGIYKHETLDQMAKEALLQSQTRGGDQITIITKNEKPRYYGSSSEIDVNLSRTNVNFIAKQLDKKLKSKQIEKVIIYGHKNADLDALGSTMGIYALAKGHDKQPFIQNETFDETTSRLIKNLTKEQQEIFISPKEAQMIQDEKTLVVICDTADENRIENPVPFKNIKKENIIVIDHHRIGKNPDFAFRENLYIDSSASSASEIVTEIISLSNNKDLINEEVAQFLLNGIYLDTNTFQKQTSAKTFAASSLLQEWGAKIIKSVNILKMDEGIYLKVKELLANIQEVKPGYYMAYKDIEASTDIISIAADEILRVNGRKAAFVVAKLPGTKLCKMSARGINTNVQIIAEYVGGGGHFGAAAAESNEDIELFVDNIKQAIVSVKDESYIN